MRSSLTGMGLRVAAMFFCAAAACAQGSEPRAVYSIDDPASVTAVVARVGTTTISAREFMLNYEFAPSFVKRRKDAKKRLLDLMINEKLFALAASAPASAANRQIAGTLSEIEGDLATEELYKREVLPHVRVSGEEIERASRDAGIYMRVRWLFATDDQKKGTVERAMNGGMSFDLLFAAQNQDSASRVNHAMEATLFDIRKNNPPVAAVLEHLAPGTVSTPVRGGDGWYFFRVDGEWTNPLQSETEQMKIRNDVQRVLIEAKADSASNRYVLALMEKHRPVIVPEAFDSLLAFLAARYLTGNKSSEWGIVPTSSASPLEHYRDLEQPRSQLLSRTLVTLTGARPVSLREFLEWYRNRETAIKLSSKSHEAFFVSAQQIVWRMVRDRLLVDRARARRMHEHAAVREQKDWWKDKLLFEAAKASLQKDIPLGDEQVRAFYELHKQDYRDSSGAVVAYERAKDDVLRDYYKVELAKRIYHRVVELRRAYPVEVRQQTLDRIPVEESQAKPIDVYAVKKGGTLPRPAFPTVDAGWQEWY